MWKPFATVLRLCFHPLLLVTRPRPCLSLQRQRAKFLVPKGLVQGFFWSLFPFLCPLTQRRLGLRGKESEGQWAKGRFSASLSEADPSVGQMWTDAEKGKEAKG